jgi:hypothetical protein
VGGRRQSFKLLFVAVDALITPLPKQVVTLWYESRQTRIWVSVSITVKIQVVVRSGGERYSCGLKFGCSRETDAETFQTLNDKLLHYVTHLKEA